MKRLLCVGGPCSGRWVSAPAPEGFSILADQETIADARAGRFDREYEPRIVDAPKTIQYVECKFYTNASSACSGTMSFWVPQPQSALETLYVLAAGYENYIAAQRSGRLVEADTRHKAVALLRRCLQLMDSGGESGRSMRAHFAEGAFRLLHEEVAEQESEFRKCDADPIGYYNGVMGKE